MWRESQDKLLCLKAGLLCIILFFWVTGVALICVGASVQMKSSDISMVIAETSSGAPLVLTIVGMVVFFVSGFGAVAVIRESNVLMKTFAAILLVVFIIEIVVGMSAYSYRDKLQRDALSRLMKVLSKYGTEKRIARAMDGVQQEFQCCGARNFTDWFNISSGISQNSVPNSCCRIVRPKCGENAQERGEKLYQEGCLLKMTMWISQHFDVIGAVGVGLGLTQILGILFSCLLVKILQDKYVFLSGMKAAIH
ncbi:Tetraspanin family [Pristimantis euphronides]